MPDRVHLRAAIQTLLHSPTRLSLETQRRVLQVLTEALDELERREGELAAATRGAEG